MNNRGKEDNGEFKKNLTIVVKKKGVEANRRTPLWVRGKHTIRSGGGKAPIQGAELGPTQPRLGTRQSENQHQGVTMRHLGGRTKSAGVGKRAKEPRKKSFPGKRRG